MSKGKNKKTKIITAVCFIVLLIGLAVFLFSGDNVEILRELFDSNVTQEEMRATLKKLGFKGYFTIGLLSMVQVLLPFVPSVPLQVMAGIAFGFWRGSLVYLVGVLLGNTLMYILYKNYGEQLIDYLHDHAEFDVDAIRHSAKALTVVMLLYVIPIVPYGLICILLASLDLKYPKYAFFTTVGSIPSILAGVGLGHVAGSAVWLAILITVLCIPLCILLYCNKSKIFAKLNHYMKNKKEYSSKHVVKKQNFFLFRAGVALSRLYFDLLLKLRLKNNVGRLKKPCIVLCNHGSFYDFVYTARLLRKEQPRFIALRLFFYPRFLGTLLKKVGCIPKSMFSVDVENARNCVRVIQQGGTLVMFPEAHICIDGKYSGVQDTTYRFIQKMGVAVYSIKLGGDYLACPKWSKRLRRGARVEAELNPLFAEGETQKISFEELKSRIDEALKNDEFEWLEKHPKDRYRDKKLAEGVENILCICPECKGKYTMKTQGRRVYCEKCGFERTMDDRYAFTQPVPFENFAKWYDWQKEEFLREIQENPDFKLEDTVQLFHSCKGGKTMLSLAGEGVTTLDKTGLTYRGMDNGQEIVKHFPLEKMYLILFGAGEDFDVHDGEEIYYFVPEEKRSCVAWYAVSRLLYATYVEQTK